MHFSSDFFLYGMQLRSATQFSSIFNECDGFGSAGVPPAFVCSWSCKTAGPSYVKASKMAALRNPSPEVSCFPREFMDAKRERQLPAQTHGTRNARAGLIPHARNPSARQVFCTRQIHRDGRIARRANVRAWAADTARA